MAGRGPAPRPDAPYSRYKREGRTSSATVLPPEGVADEPPEMPSGRAWTADEQHMWAELWQSPQASQWDESFVAVVAVYVRLVHVLLSGRPTSGIASEVRFLADQLGLTPKGLRDLNWRIGDGGADIVPFPGGRR